MGDNFYRHIRGASIEHLQLLFSQWVLTVFLLSNEKIIPFLFKTVIPKLHTLSMYILI